MTPLRRKLEGIITGTLDDPLLSPLLGCLSVVYGGLLRLRAEGYRRGDLKSRRLPCRVVSVGNITAGGTGKTPMTIYLATGFQRFGYRVAVVSRGYGGSAQKTGGIVSDGEHISMTPASAGDEPLMMARSLPGIPVLVGGDRYRSGITAFERFHPDIIILDDGFQHLKLKRDLDLVLLDCRRPLGNGRVLPRGPLREPIAALERADAFVFTRCDGSTRGPGAIIPFLPSSKPVFHSAHRPYVYRILKADTYSVAQKTKLDGDTADNSDSNRLLQGRRVFVFSGIANHRSFLDTVRRCGGIPAGHLDYPDHHPYSAADLKDIHRSAHAAGARWLVTTEKDFVRLSESIRLPLNLIVLGISIALNDRETDFWRFLFRQLDLKKDLPHETD